MSDLAYRQQKIQEKRRQTPRREFVMEICSWIPIILYRNNDTISVYPVTDKVSITSNRQFHSNREMLLHNHFKYNDKLSFIENFALLFGNFTFPATHEYSENENALYSELSMGSRNVYLSFMVINSENAFYSYSVKNNCINVYSSIHIWNNCDTIFSSTSVDSSSHIFYSKYINNSHNIWFSENLVGCNNCILCNGLENSEYCIENKKYTKDEYLLKRDVLLSDKYNFISRYDSLGVTGGNITSQNVTGSRIIESVDIQNGYYIKQVNNGRNLFMVGGKDPCSNLFDLVVAASSKTDNVYGCVGCGSGDNFYSSFLSGIGSNLYYCYFCDTCSFCLGCIGLKNKSYCILNKQYTKEERYQKIDEIFGQMDAEGTLGGFFPPTMNPFYFNDTAAYLIDPTFTKEEVTAAGYLRRDEPIKVDIPEGVQTVKTDELEQFEGFDQDGNRTINDEVLKKVILDEQGNTYRIIPMELEFLRKYGLPLPRKHWLERMKENFKIQ